MSRNFEPIISRINTSINGASSYERLLKQYMKQLYNSIEEIKLTRNIRRDMPLYLNRKAHFNSKATSGIIFYFLLKTSRIVLEIMLSPFPLAIVGATTANNIPRLVAVDVNHVT